MKIFLIGLPGSGKSTFGLKLSRYLGIEFIDTDDEIIRAEEENIETIFQKKGEAYFREKEHSALLKVAECPEAVISTGGGTPCFFNNMEIINSNGISLFLNIPLEVIVKRLMKGKNKNRPMVVGKSYEQLMDFLKKKYEERLPYYSLAKYEIASDRTSFEALMTALKEKGFL
jgi:shikimate kinase